VPVDLDGAPAEAAQPLGVGRRVPAVHRLAALAQTVDVEDGDQIVEVLVAGVLERLPHRAFGELGVAADDPDAVRDLVEVLARQRDADADRQPLPERPRRDVDPGDERRRMALEAAPELAEGEQLLVGDRARCLEHRVDERRGVALGEDQMVVAGILRLVEVVAQEAGEEHGQQVRRGHRRGRMPRPCRGGGAHRIDPQLLSQLTPLLVLVHPRSS
jgi:hypothetical protein